MDADKIKKEEQENKTLEYFDAVTENAVQHLESAIKTEKFMEERLYNSDDKDEAI